jgi:hypothetical protein
MSAHLNFAVANMCRSNAATHALLNSNPISHLLLIQEPWFDTIGTARADQSREGVDVLGGAASPGWDLYYPTNDTTHCPNVMAYSHKCDWVDRESPARFSISPQQDLCVQPCVQVLDLATGPEIWRIVNFYHDKQDATLLETLLALDLDPLIPTLVTGDFNTHS